MSNNETWLEQFKKSLVKQDLATSTVNGYLYDLSLFKTWIEDFYQQEIPLIQVSTNDIRAYREYLVKIKRHKVASVNRRIQSIKRFYNWVAKTEKTMKEQPARDVRFMRRGKRSQPTILTKKEVHDLLRVSGQSPQGLAKRNYALVQLLLQSGLRIGEAAQIQIRDLVLQERSGYAKIVDGKGHKFREVPLNSTARRALNNYFDTRVDLKPEDHVFISKRGYPQSIRGLQKIIQTLLRRANVTRISASAHTLRHTFALNYLNANPGSLVALSTLLGHESLDTTAIYTQASREDLSESIERNELNLLGDI
jgi:site-specific recombinase XerD